MKIFDNIMSWKKPEMLDLAKELNIKGRLKSEQGRSGRKHIGNIIIRRVF